MNIQDLIYFVSCARTLSITRAAEENFIVQSAMSWHITKMETELGFKLFFRDKRSISLTPPGRVFYEEIVPLLDQYDKAVKKAEKTTNTPSDGLSICYWGPTETSILSGMLTDFHNKYPDIKIHILQNDIRSNIKHLQDGDVDIFFTHPITVQNENQFEYHSFMQIPLCIFVNKNDPLAKEEKIFPEMLKDKEFIFLDSGDMTVFDRELFSICSNMGFEPHIRQHTFQLSALMLMITVNLGITLLPAIPGSNFGPNITVKKIENGANLDFGIACKKGNI